MIKIPENPCAICRKEETTQLCDFIVEYSWMSHKGQVTSTCDLPMCEKCSTNHNAHDFCPQHAAMLPELDLKDKTLVLRKHLYWSKQIQEAGEKEELSK